MATLVSPGVDVQIIDESFYGSAGAGTVPLIVIATAANKPSPSGTGIAPYTAPSQAGRLFLATSQRELVQNFGNPVFHSVQGTQLHGHELNEYGLHAAYSFLGLSNRAYVIRADIDLNQLAASDSAPRGEPVAGTYWLDLTETRWGVFQSNGNPVAGSAWEVQPVKVALSGDVVSANGLLVPASTFGTDGDFAVVPLTAENFIYEKINGSWLHVGSNAWKAARPTKIVGTANPLAVNTGDAIRINGTVVTFSSGSLGDVIAAINGASIPNIQASIANNALQIAQTAGGVLQIADDVGTPLARLGITAGNYKGVQTFYTNSAAYPANSVPGDVWIKGNSANQGAEWKVKRYDANIGQWVSLTTPLFAYNSALSDGDPIKDQQATIALGAPASGTVYVAFDAATGVMELRRWTGQFWEGLIYEADLDAPTTDPEDGVLWYNTDFRADIMVSDGVQWMAYRRRYPLTNPTGPILAGSAPLTQTDGTPLVDNDLWIDTSDLENYPVIRRYDATALRWRLIDVADQTTPFGIIFADVRADSGVSFTGIPNSGAYAFMSEDPEDMALSDFVDPDAPDARTVPDGMLCFNTRYSTYNVKVWRPRHFEDGGFDPNTNFSITTYAAGPYVFPAVSNAGRWVTASGNKTDGSPWMGRKAQRVMVVRSMSSVIQANEDLRSELVYFNLMAAPGYPEMVDELVELNKDQKEVSFIIADTPIRLKPTGTEIQAWALNQKLAPSNGEDGLTSSDIYTGVYYPWGLGRNIDGMEVMIPPSAMALRVFAYNDEVGYPWYAPAGFERGLVTNATTVGYLTDEGEFRPVLLNPGQRDVLYTNKINPIAFIPGRGLVLYGQKTLSPLQSALDRVNVARLANHLKYVLDLTVRPFLFEQNDQITRDAARITVERVLSGLVGLRALEDYAVLCDESNNTPERRDRNELWLDVLIRPIKAVEFIYVPVRIRNSGDDLSLNS